MSEQPACPNPSPPSLRPPTGLLLAAWLLALLLNALVACYRPSSSPDSDRYQRIALNLANGHGYSASEAAPYQPDLLRAPAYPAFLALVVRVAGPNWRAVRLVQALLLSFLVPLGWLLAARCFDRTTATVTAFAIAAYPYYWLYAGQLLSDGLASVLTALAALLLHISLHTPRRWPAAVAGAACGLLCLAKPIMLLFPLAALALYLLHRRNHSGWLVRGLLYLLAAAAVVLPWTARNAAVTGQLIPVTAGKGLMLYQMARYAAEGLSMSQYHAQVQCADTRIMLAQAADDPAVTTRLDRELTTEALGLIRQHPLPYLRTIALTPLTIWLNLYAFAGGKLVVSRPHLGVSLLYLIPGLLGVYLARRRLLSVSVPLAVMVYLSLAHLPIWSEPRQSLPGRLCLLAFAAYGVTQLLGRWHRRGTPARDVVEA